MSVESLIETLAPNGLQIHIVPVLGGYQVSVGGGHSTNSWTCETQPDVTAALTRAMTLRLSVSVAHGANPPPPAVFAGVDDDEDLIG